uniref:DUF4760 domain-containing protein n=1 Tax=uncultured Acidobacteriota bacterium TaxID=171953 RepID=Q7X2T8_9BACT|nr:hypothetical protein [uncultured Acidobacteriota bacterium]
MSRLFTILLAILCLVLGVGLGTCYWNRGWLTISSAADLFSIFASIAVVVSLLFIAFQVKQQTRLARAANSQAFVNIQSDFVLAAGSNQSLMEFYQTGGEKFETLDPSEQARYRYLVAWWLTFYENVQYQQDCGLLDEGVYKAWMKDMAGFIERRRVEKVWEFLKPNYSDTFIVHIQPYIDAVRKKH